MVRAVVEYSGMDFRAALALPCDLFQLMYKNWYVDRLSETEEGRQYLRDCERLKQTKLDREGLRRIMEAMETG